MTTKLIKQAMVWLFIVGSAQAHASFFPKAMKDLAEKAKCVTPEEAYTDSEVQDPPYALGLLPSLIRKESGVFLCVNAAKKLEVRVYVVDKSKDTFKCPTLIDTQGINRFGLRISDSNFEGKYFVSIDGGKTLGEKETKGPVVVMSLNDDSIEYRYYCKAGKWYVQMLH